MDLVGNRTLYSLLASHASRHPDAPWLTFEQEDSGVLPWTWAEFLADVHRAANFLQSLGIGKGDVFNIHLTNHPAHPQLLLAASCLGAIVLPTNPKGTEDELKYLLEHSESKIVFTDAAALATVQGVSSLPVVLCGEASSGLPIYEQELARQSSERPASRGGADDVVQYLYTSGTTSRPKGVMLTNANIIYGAEVFRTATGLRADDHHLIALPLFHAAAQCHAFWPSLVAGCRVTILHRFSASRFFIQAGRHGATMAALFGAPLRMLLSQPERPTDRLSALRNITFAQSLSETDYAEWERRFVAPLQQLWGMTETCSLPVMSPLVGDRRLGAMGRPVLGYEVKIVDEEGVEVPVGVTGELCVKGVLGRSLMRGYLKNPEATAKTLRPAADGVWLYSGDMVRCDEDDFFHFMYRGNDLIRRAGENISGVEVEGVIADLEGVLEVCVVGVPDPILDEAVAAVVVIKSGAQISAEEIRQHCAKKLISFKVPERIEFVDLLPRTSVGKIQKGVVKKLLSERIS